jgi:integrase
MTRSPDLRPGQVGKVTFTGKRGDFLARAIFYFRDGKKSDRTARGNTQANAEAALLRKIERLMDEREYELGREERERVAAEQAAAAAAAALAEHDPTLDEVAERWFIHMLTHTKKRRSSSTVASYRATYRGSLSKVLGKKGINALTTEEVFETLVNGLYRRKKNSTDLLLDAEGNPIPLTGEQPWDVMNLLLKYAIASGIRRDKVHLMATMERPDPHEPPPPRSLPHEDWVRLYERACQATRERYNYKGNTDLEDWLLSLWHTGTRGSEWLAVRWSDLRLERAEPDVFIGATMADGRDGLGQYRSEKRKKGAGLYIVLHPEVVAMLRRRQARGHHTEPDDFVFATSPHGRPVIASNLRTKLRVLLPEVDLEWFTPHNLRDSMATAANSVGGRKLAATLLGHTDDGSTAFRSYIDDGIEEVNPLGLREGLTGTKDTDDDREAS